MKDSQALVYCDEGVSAFSCRQTIKTLKDYPSLFSSVKVVNRATLAKREWIKKTSLLVIPGGRDIPYDRALRGTINRDISHFVHSGGCYLGICAGGYYGAQKVVFAKETKYAVEEERELQFFPGKAIGTINDPYLFDYNSEKGAFAAQLSFHNKKAHFYYNGGCYFENMKNLPENISILAKYQEPKLNNPPAIISCDIGEGKAILSGVHFEYPVNSLKEDKLPPGMFSLLQQSELERKSLCHSILSSL